MIAAGQEAAGQVLVRSKIATDILGVVLDVLEDVFVEKIGWLYWRRRWQRFAIVHGHVFLLVEVLVVPVHFVKVGWTFRVKFEAQKCFVQGGELIVGSVWGVRVQFQNVVVRNGFITKCIQ